MCQVFFFFYTLFRLLWEFTYLIWHFFGFHKYTQLDWLLFLAPLLTTVSHLCSLDFCWVNNSWNTWRRCSGWKAASCVALQWHPVVGFITFWCFFPSFIHIHYPSVEIIRLFISVSALCSRLSTVTHTNNNSVRWSVLCWSRLRSR